MDRVSNVTYRFDGDASGYVESVMQVERANARAATSAARLGEAGRSVSESLRGQEVRLTQSAQSFSRFAQSIDPALRRQAQLTAGTERLARALDEGRVPLQEHDRLLGLLQKKYGDTTAAQTSAVTGFGRLAAGAAAGAAAYYAVSGAITTYINATDQAKRVESQLKLVTSGSGELTRVSDELFASAQRNRSGFEETAGLYARVARNADQLGISQRQVFNLSDNVAKAIRISGASASEASAGVIQFGQALASGRLSGDEFRSVMENTPRLALALADGLGVTIGQLRAMANEQRLTADVVIPALLSQTGKLRDEFGKMNVTIAESGTVFENSLSAAIARLDQATGASGNLAKSIIGIAGAIDVLSGKKFTVGEQIDRTARRIEILQQDIENPNTSSQLRVLKQRQIEQLRRDSLALQRTQRAQENFQDTRDFLGRQAGNAMSALRASPLGANLFLGERDRRAEDQRKLAEESAKTSAKVIEGLQRENELARMSADERRIELKARQAVADLGERVTASDRDRVETMVRESERARIAAERAQTATAKVNRDSESAGARQARQLQDYLSGLGNQVRLNGMSAEARREEEAVMRGMALAGDKIGASDRARLEERIRLTHREGQAALKQREELDELDRRNHENRLRAIEDERQAREDMIRSIEGEFRDLWNSVSRSGSQGLGGLIDNLKSRLLSVASDVGFDAVIRPLAQDVGRLFAGPVRPGLAANDNALGVLATPLDGLAKATARLAPDFDRLGDNVSALGATASSAARQAGALGNSLQAVLAGAGGVSAAGGPQSQGAGPAGTGGALNGILGSNGLAGVLDRLGDRLGLQNSATLTRNAGRVPFANPQGIFGEGSTTSLGGLAGGAFAGASVGQGLTGIFGRTGPGSAIGGALGGAAGMAIGGPIGSLVGSIAGSLIGSAFGPRPTDATAVVQFDQFGRAGAAEGRKATEQTRGLAGQAASLITGALTELERDGGFAFDRTVTKIGIGTRDRSGFDLSDGRTYYSGTTANSGDLANAVLRELLKSAKTQSADLGIIAAKEFSSVEELTKAVAFTRDVYGAIVDARPGLTQVEQAMKDMTARFSDARRETERLGLSVAKFDAGAIKTFDRSIRDALRQFTDPVGLALEEFERGADARLTTARKLGADLVQVERLNAMERATVLKQTAAESFGGLKSLIDDIRIGGLSSAAPEQRYFDSVSRLNAARREALTNRDAESIREFESVARDTLPVLRDFLGTSERYRDLQNEVVSAAVDLSGGLADPAGIARTGPASVDLSALRPALEDMARQAAMQLQAIQSGDSQTVAAVQNLVSEFQRLNASLSAILNRAA